MRFRGTVVLFVLLAALGAWIYFADVRGRDAREAAEEAAARLLAVDAARIVELRLVGPDRTVAASRTDAGWRFDLPAGYEADSERWDTLAGDVGRIDRGETVVSSPEDPARFGLDEPRLRVVVGFDDGRSEEILFGAENPQGTFDYVKLASGDDVVLVGSTWMDLFDKTADELRDRTVLRFEQENVDAIEVSGRDVLSLRQDGEDWDIEQPIAAGADNSQVSTLLGAIDFARASGFAGSEATDEQTGLGSPAWRIVLRDTSSGVADELLIGGSPPENPAGYYARDASRPHVFVIDSQIVDLVSAPVLDWRDKSIVDLDRASVGSIEIARAGDSATVELERTGDDWVLVGESGGPADFGRVSAMLSALEFGAATDIIDAPRAAATDITDALDEYGLLEPAIRIVLRDTGGATMLDARFGAAASGDDQVYWKRADEAEVKIVSRDLYDRFDLTAGDLAAEAAIESLPNPE